MLDALTLSRAQFGMTAGFHILWPLLSIGISLYMVVMEALFLKTKNPLYYQQIRFWTKIFLITFALGVATGFPLEFQFGTNWSTFSKSAGDFFGNTLGFEATVAFMLESAFLALFVFGWRRISQKMHIFSNFMVFVGATLSAFWIMAANSWMQTPAGVVLDNGIIRVTDYFAAVFNPTTMVSFIHMWIACVLTSMFFIAAICAWHLLRKPEKRYVTFWLSGFKVALVIIMVVSCLQFISGDASARSISQYQPAKAAAIEAHWETNEPGTGAAWNIIADPDDVAEKNLFAVSIPNVLSILTNHTMKSSVLGLDSIPKADRPPTQIPFWSFRIMILCGVIMLLMALWGLWAWWKKQLTNEKAVLQKWFWRLWCWSWPLGFIATEAGWAVREVGRQPWIVTGYIRTTDGVTPNLSAINVLYTYIGFALFYIIASIFFIIFTLRIVRKGPNLDEVPHIVKAILPAKQASVTPVKNKSIPRRKP